MSLPLMTSPTVGTRIAPHLTLRSVLGSGGAATVFEAIHARLRAPVAVKISMVHGPRAAEAATRLVREARMFARLGEAYFPRVYDIGCLSDGRPYYVMEKVSGTTLDSYVAARGADLVGAVRLVHQLLSALDVLHSHGIIHLDVKPTNILIESDAADQPCLRLIDFGLARLSSGRPFGGDAHAEVFGTPGYMAPEQACGRAVDGRSDVHAAGLVLYELVAGRSPYDVFDPVELMHAVVEVPMPDVRTHSPTCPSYVAEWIAKATAKDPAERFASAREARRALSGLEHLQPELDDPLGVILLRAPRSALFRGPMDSRNEQLAALQPSELRRRMAVAATVVATVATGAWCLPGAVSHEETPATMAASKPDATAEAGSTGRLRPVVGPLPAGHADTRQFPGDQSQTDIGLAAAEGQPAQDELGVDAPAALMRPLATRVRDHDDRQRSLRRHERRSRAREARTRLDRASHELPLGTRIDRYPTRDIPENPY